MTTPTKKQIQIHSLTKRYNGIARVIESPIEIYNTITNQKEATKAIWDTGATNSVITKSLAQKLGLSPVAKTNVKGVHGVKTGVPVYPVRIVLNNQNVTFTLPVTECEQLSDDDSAGFLIGMDIITKGDFIVSNFQGETVMTFRVPSLQRFDFVQTYQEKEKVIKAEERKKARRDFLYKAKPNQ